MRRTLWSILHDLFFTVFLIIIYTIKINVQNLIFPKFLTKQHYTQTWVIFFISDHNILFLLSTQLKLVSKICFFHHYASYLYTKRPPTSTRAMFCDCWLEHCTWPLAIIPYCGDDFSSSRSWVSCINTEKVSGGNDAKQDTGTQHDHAAHPPTHRYKIHRGARRSNRRTPPPAPHGRHRCNMCMRY